MSPLVSLNQIQMTMGSKLLFEGLSLGIFENERIGLIGPNGAGKSTLLKIIAGLEKPDSGDVNVRRSLAISYLAQRNDFNDSKTISAQVIDHLKQKIKMDPLQAEVQAAVQLSMAGFDNLDQPVSELSGGWRKRLAIAQCLAEDPDLLILDEPTNHMDWDGLLWLEDILENYHKTFLLVSHDRVFLNQLTNRIIEINPLYKDGFLSFNTSYYDFLTKKEEYVEAQMNLQKTLSNKARREIDWLRAGVKARTTKSSARMKEAYELIDQLGAVSRRNRAGQSSTRLEIDSTQRKTKKLLEIKKLCIGYGDKVLVKDLDLILGPQFCLGIIGQNGSGKTTFLKTLQNPEKALSGEIKKADDLKIVYFDQKRETLPQNKNLMQYLGEGSDQVVFKNSSMHVASYASRFLFSTEKMNLRIEQLSGGEQARLLIAKLFLQPADILILDEPTNDLDIDTIEVIENTLNDFEGLVILVSHDRKFMDVLCNSYLVLEGMGAWASYANIDQWLNKMKNQKSSSSSEQVDTSHSTTDTQERNNSSKKNKLSYKEKRALETIEEDIQSAEAELEKATFELESFKDFSNATELNKKISSVSTAQAKVTQLYSLWEDLEKKL